MAYPIRDVVRPTVLTGQTNGRLTSGLMTTPGLAGGPVVSLVEPAARAWRALTAAAAAAGHTLQATSSVDSYRPYAVQESTFRARYTTTRLAGRPSVVWSGRTWWQRAGTAAAAVPGTSNHGWGLAVDVANASGALLAWLLVGGDLYGWSWELQSEAWHIRYCDGDRVPAAVLAHETTRGEVMAVVVRVKETGACWVSSGATRLYIGTQEDLREVVAVWGPARDIAAARLSAYGVDVTTLRGVPGPVGPAGAAGPAGPAGADGLGVGATVTIAGTVTSTG